MTGGIPIVVLSHKRAGRVRTHKHVAGCLICVPESQEEQYAAHHKPETIVAHPDTVVGLPAKRQWVYEKFGDVFMLDDDCTGLYRIWKPSGMLRRAVCSAGLAEAVVKRTAETAREIGAYLFGFASHANPVSYDANKPLGFGGYSPGGAIGILAGSKLYWPRDTTLPIDDYWICCLNAHFHRYGFYDRRFAFGFAETYTGQGGMAEFRKTEAEADATRYLKRHFGSMVVPKRNSTLTKRQKNSGGRSLQWPYGI